MHCSHRFLHPGIARTYIIVSKEFVELLSCPRLIAFASDHSITHSVHFPCAMGEKFCDVEWPIANELERLEEPNGSCSVHLY